MCCAGPQLSGLRETDCTLAGPQGGFTSGGIRQPGAEAVRIIDPVNPFEKAKPGSLEHVLRIVARES